MGQCEYSTGFLDGHHCKITGGKVNDASLVEYYCTMYTKCSHCPIRGGDDYPRQKDRNEAREKAQEEAQQKAQEAAEAARRKAQEEETSYHSGGGTDGGSSDSSSGGGDSGSGGGSLGCGGFWIFLIICAVVVALVFLGDLFGWFGPWAQMQVPASAATKDLRMYSISREGDHYFEVMDEYFDKDGLCKLRTEYKHNDVYLEQDGASVWLGTCDLWVLNTGVITDITYDEAVQQMVRPLLLQLQDSDGQPLTQLLPRVTDAQGTALPCVAVGEGTYAVLLPNDTPDQPLTLRTDGYDDQTIPVNSSSRLSKIIITLRKAGNAG